MKKLLYFAFLGVFAFFGTVNCETETLNWLVDGQTYTTTTCESGGDIILPNPPSKPGYVFRGWRLGYTPIEYLESTGTQWIDTGIPGNTIYGIEIEFKSNDGIVSEYPSILSASLDDYTIGVLHRSRNSLYVRLRSVEIAQLSLSNNAWNTITMLNGVLKLNNVVKTTYNQGQFSTRTNNLFIFNNPGLNRPATISLKTLRVYDVYNTLVRDFIPVLDVDGVACMYDKVEGNFYYNAGTGDFIAGPVIIE